MGPSLSCPQCGYSLPLSDQQLARYQGKKVKCPKCSGGIAVPATGDTDAGAGSGAGFPTDFDVAPPPMPMPPAPPPQPPLSYRSPAATTPTSRFRDFADFRTMITPRLIIAIFWIGSILLVLGGLLAVLVGAFGQHNLDSEQVLSGLMMMFLGPLALRLYCEVFIVIFRINETLTEIKRTADRY